MTSCSIAGWSFQCFAVVLACAGNLSLAAAKEPTPTQSPNIILVLADDLGNGDLACRGAEDMRTPHLDELFRSGLEFDRFYANSSVCSPTRASLMTGRYPELVGVPGVIRTHAENSWGHLAASAQILPIPLKQRGYQTALIGKWHLGLEPANHPLTRGFDYFHGFLGDMMDDYYDHSRHEINYMRLNRQVIDPTGHATDLFTDWACDYVRRQSKTPEPFFLYLAYNAPHTPIQPPQEWLERVRQREPQLSEKRAKLVALIEHMDDGIGKVLATLEDVGLTEDTIVVFTSDNGGQLNVGANNGDLRDGKQSMYEGGLRVPTVIRWPGVTPAGKVNSVPTMTMDLYPTICEMAAADAPTSLDGISMVELCRGERSPHWKRDLFFHRREGGERYGGLIINGVLRDDWKLLQNSPFGPQELFNLREDPQENDERSTKAPKIRRELQKALRRQVQRGGEVPWQAPESK